MQANPIGMDPKNALIAVEPSVREAAVGRHRVLRFATKTPAHTFESALLVLDDSRMLQLVARDSFDEQLAAFLFDQVVPLRIAPDEELLTVIPAHFPDPWAFDCIVVASPVIAKRFEGRSDYLQSRTFWVFPAFQGEFSAGDGTKQFWHQLGRKDGWRIHIVDWQRRPKTNKTWD